MAHFARIENGVVTSVLVVDNEQEHRGEEFLNELFGTSDVWIQTSYNSNFRKRFAGVGCSYDSVADEFVAPQPFPSWTLNSSNDWVPPVPHPEGPEGDYFTFYWDEDNQQWAEIEQNGEESE
jgi:hypothetical protein